MRGGGDDQPELGEAGHGLVHVGVLGEDAGGSHHQPEDDVDAGDQPQARRAEPDGCVDERDGGQQAPRQEGSNAHTMGPNRQRFRGAAGTLSPQLMNPSRASLSAQPQYRANPSSAWETRSSPGRRWLRVPAPGKRRPPRPRAEVSLGWSRAAITDAVTAAAALRHPHGVAASSGHLPLASPPASPRTNECHLVVTSRP